MVTAENKEIEINPALRNEIIEKLIENEKCLEKGDRTFSKDEMNTILDWTLGRYA